MNKITNSMEDSATPMATNEIDINTRETYKAEYERLFLCESIACTELFISISIRARN